MLSLASPSFTCKCVPSPGLCLPFPSLGKQASSYLVLMPEGLGGGRGEELMTQKGKSSGNYALRYGSATQIQLLALFQIPFPN